MEEVLVLAAIVIVPLILVPWLALGLVMLVAGFPRLKLRQLAGIVLVSAWVCALFFVPDQVEWLLIITVVLLMLIFAGMWLYEFRNLMQRSDDEFPGRFDKLIWSLALLFLAPAGVWLFRLYRQSQWPVTPAIRREGMGSPSSARVESEDGILVG